MQETISVMKKSIQNHINMTDIARQAGVTQATVSRILNNKPGFRQETRDRVLDVMSSMGYQAHILNQIRQVKKKMLKCTFLVCSLSEQKCPMELPFFHELDRALRKTLREYNVEMTTRPLPFGVLMPPEDDADAYILAGAPAESICRNLAARKIPFLIINNIEVQNRDFNLIASSTFETGVRIAQYLLGESCRRIGCLADRNSLEFCAGMEFQLQKNGLSIGPEDRKVLFSSDADQAVLRFEEWLNESSLPDGIFINHIASTRAILEVLKRHKIRVPEELKIITLATSLEKDGSDVPIVPTFYIYPEKTGRFAARRLLEIIKNPEEEPYTILVPRVLRIPETGQKRKRKA